MCAAAGCGKRLEAVTTRAGIALSLEVQRTRSPSDPLVTVSAGGRQQRQGVRAGAGGVPGPGRVAAARPRVRAARRRCGRPGGASAPWRTTVALEQNVALIRLVCNKLALSCVGPPLVQTQACVAVC